MSKFPKMIGQQFANPHGFVGWVCCKIMNVINRQMYRNVVKEINANDSATILDVGYGNGYLLKQLDKKFGCNLYGIEVSSDAEKLATMRNKKGVYLGRIRLMQADCCDMPFDEQTFDFITTVNTIYFWQDTEKGLSEIARVLKNDGKFYNAVYSREWLQKLAYTKEGFKFFDQQDYIDLGRNAGFAKVEIVDIKKSKNFLIVFTK